MADLFDTRRLVVMVRKIASIINIVLLTVAVYLAVNFFYKVVGGKLEAAFPANYTRTAQVRPRGADAGRPLRDYDVIAQRNIFKAKEKKGEQSLALDLEKLKKTDLDLRLLGTIAGLGKDSYAVIEQTKTRSQDLYKVGDTIDQARIKLILRKKIVLTIDGRDEVLEIPEERLNAMTDSGDSPPDQGRFSSFQSGQAGDVTNINLNRDDVERAFNNVNELMRTVRVRPHFSGGKPDGLRLDNVTSGSIFSEMGLQDRDVIVGVNSRRINSVDDCMEVYRNLSSASELMLEIKRGESSRFIKYNIR
jgi:general secretion pathway protein C